MKIYVCVDGGIVNDVYVEKDFSDPKPDVIVLDVDRDRADTQAIRDKWAMIATNESYESADVTFLDTFSSSLPEECFAALETTGRSS